MRSILRVASFGGWLAHHINQSWLADNSKSVRPLFLGFVVALAAVTAGLIGSMLLFDPAARVSDNWIGALLTGSLVLLLIVGWFTDTVPFVAAAGESSESAPAHRMAGGKAVSAHATGVVGLDDDRRRFRHRSAVVERLPNGELSLAVRRWRSDFAASGPPGTSASGHLAVGDVSKVRRGTAHLVTAARPAVCFRWNGGPVILDFADPETRDRVYAELAALAAERSSRRSVPNAG